jgi:alanine dehydrogenase
MNIGILDQIKNNRYLITPDTAKLLANSGSNVYFTTEIERTYSMEISNLKSHKFPIKEDSEVKKIFLFIKKQLKDNNNFTIENYELVRKKIEMRIKKLYRDKIFKDIKLIKSIYLPFFKKVTGYEFLVAGAVRRENNQNIIKNSTILTCYNLPKDDLNLINEKHTLICYSNALKNHKKIKKISEKKASILAIEHIKDINGDKIIQKIISELSARVGFNLINSILNEQGIILGNTPFNNKLNVTILGYGKVGKEIASLFHKFDSNITIFDKRMEVLGDNPSYSFFSIHNENKLKECISNSNLIISAIGNNLSPCAKVLTRDYINLIDKTTLLFDFSINQGGIIEDPTEIKYRSNVSELYNVDYLNRNLLYSGISDILSVANISVSNYISNVLVMYLAMILEEKTNLPFFDSAFIVKNGVINENINFLENDEEAIPNIEDPFDLMDEEITESWRKMDDVNELLEGAKDYGESSAEKDSNTKR